MSDDPETARQIAELASDDRPLLVLDVDEVVLEFVQPFMRYLESIDLELGLATFSLFQNVVRRSDRQKVEPSEVAEHLDTFFAVQAEWQTAAADAAETIARLSRNAEIVMLTAMPHRHRPVRRAHLDALGFPYPLLTTEMPKGPAILKLRGPDQRPVAFVDDIPKNLLSVRDFVADAHLVNLMSYGAMRAVMPPLPADIAVADDWKTAAPSIEKALGI